MPRFKTRIPGPSFPRSIGQCGNKRIEQGEPWLRVWSQQLAVPLATIARKAKLDMARLLEIEFGAQPMDEELQAIAAALQTEVKLIEQRRNPSP